MNNNNEENRRYPLSMITRMRKKDEKRKKVLKIILTSISFILIFAIGFVSGFYYGDSGKVNPEPTVATASPKKGTTSEPVVKSDAAASDGNVKSDGSLKEPTEVEPKYTEEDMLHNWETEFKNAVSQVCPEATLSFAIKNLDNGKELIHNNTKMNSASVIKLFIMETVYKEAAIGAYEITPEREEALFKMITDSDNDAANMFIDDFGGLDDTRKVKDENKITQTIKASGYECTEANRKMYTTAPPGGSTGYENYTCAKDVIKLLEGIYNKTLFDEPYNTNALELLKAQIRREKIPKKIDETYPDVTVANKTGELSSVENDVSLILSDDFNLAFVVLINNIPETETGEYDIETLNKIRDIIADYSLKLVENYKENKF